MKMLRQVLVSGAAARERRSELGLSQAEFWSRVGVTQGGGSRYESGQSIPLPVQLILDVAYAPGREAQKVIDHLRARPGSRELPDRKAAAATALKEPA